MRNGAHFQAYVSHRQRFTRGERKVGEMLGFESLRRERQHVNSGLHAVKRKLAVLIARCLTGYAGFSLHSSN
ncbi:MAG TPA: hypothetical protein VHX20_03975 [Terracidiphilus sp.]|nr:hypothetical protein [Terracidiphilus sp.]